MAIYPRWCVYVTEWSERARLLQEPGKCGRLLRNQDMAASCVATGAGCLRRVGIAFRRGSSSQPSCEGSVEARKPMHEWVGRGHFGGKIGQVWGVWEVGPAELASGLVLSS